MLQEILVDEWGFDGFVVSDWGGSNDHALGVKNGSHLEMPGTGKSGMYDIIHAVENGDLDEAVLDQRLDELLNVIFSTHQATEDAKGKTFDVEAHHNLARKAAEESIVLLKNEDQILPLKPGTKVAVIGDFAKVPRYQGAGSSLVNSAKQPEAILDVIGSTDLDVVAYEQGYIRNRKPNQKLTKAAVELAKKADVVLFFGGLDEISESEGLDRYADYHGAVILAAAIGYVIQLYMEFSGCMDIIIGSGKLFGICLPENFRQPFCAKNPSEFWRRWHITLGAWFKAYIFYPVSVSGLVKKWNQYGRKHCGKHITRLVTSAIALFPVWVANGVWHGAQWNYIFYGMYYFVLIMLGIAVEPVRDCILETCHINPETRVWRTIQIAKTWVIIVVGELFFRANGLKAGWYMFCNMIKHFDAGQLTDGTLYTLGLERADYLAVIVGCLIVGIVGSMKEHGIHVQKKMGELAVPVRWGLYYALIIGILIFAAYGDGYQIQDLIYAGF